MKHAMQPRRRSWILSAVFASILALGAPVTAQESKLTSLSSTSLVEVSWILPIHVEDARYGKLPPKGGGHVGSGATLLPIVDEDFLFIQVVTL